MNDGKPDYKKKYGFDIDFELYKYWNEPFDIKEPITVTRKGKLINYYYILKTDSSFSNKFNTMHGGAVYTMLNTFSSKSLLFEQKNKLKTNNISVYYDLLEMTVKYLSPIACGSKILVEVSIQKLGKTLSYVNCSVYNISNVDFDEMIAKMNLENVKEGIDTSVLNLLTTSQGSFITKTKNPDSKQQSTDLNQINPKF